MSVIGLELSGFVRQALLGVSGISEEIDNERVYFYQHGRLFSIVDDEGLYAIPSDLRPLSLSHTSQKLISWTSRVRDYTHFSKIDFHGQAE